MLKVSTQQQCHKGMRPLKEPTPSIMFSGLSWCLCRVSTLQIAPGSLHVTGSNVRVVISDTSRDFLLYRYELLVPCLGSL